MEVSRERLQALREKNIQLTRRKIRDSVKKDHLVIQAINCLDELGRTANTLSKRLKEWYSLYSPEVVRKYEDHEKFTKEVTSKSKNQLLEICKIKREPMGAELEKGDVHQIIELAKLVQQHYFLIESQKEYIEDIVKKTYPNVYELTGGLIGAQLIEHAGSLRNLATMSASKIQLLGAEKALFRHLRTGAKSPKHGLLIQHHFVGQAKQKGRAARHIADKISIASRVDYFKGNFVGKKLKEELEKKAKK